MGNIGGLEIVMVLMVALIVLGPTKLPEAARQIGKVVTEFRRISSGFQRELREAIQDPITEAEARAKGALESTQKAVDDAKNAVIQPFQTNAPFAASTDPTAGAADKSTDAGSTDAESTGDAAAEASTDDD